MYLRLLIALAISTVATNCAAAVRTVALSGAQVPGMPPDTVFERVDDVQAVSINEAGQVLFGGSFVGPNGERVGGRFVEHNGSIRLVAAPEAPPDRFFGSDLFTRGINAAGQVIFSGAFVDSAGQAVDSTGIWMESAGVVQKIAHSSDHPPGTEPGVTFVPARLRSRNLNDAGQTVFWAELQGPGVTIENNHGIWLGRPGELNLIARAGDPVPGTAPGVTFRSMYMDYLYPTLNNRGQTAFRAAIAGPGVSNDNDYGLWFWNGSSMSLLAREGDEAPGTFDGTKFAREVISSLVGQLPTYPVLNNAGDLAFRGLLSGPNGDPNDHGLWIADSDTGDMELVLRKGDVAPGAGPDFEFSAVGLGLAINRSAQIAFFGEIEGPAGRTTGIWTGGSDSLHMVARTGSSAPGTEDGAVFRFGLTTPSLNERGQVTFTSRLTGPRIDDTNDIGIWAETIDHQLKLIAREGDLLEVGPGDFRTISFLGQHYLGRALGNEDNAVSMFNDRGQVAFNAFFTDGSSGVFISDLVAVPEPSALTLVLAVLITCGLSRRATV